MSNFSILRFFVLFQQNFFWVGKSPDYPWALTDEKMIISVPWVEGQGTEKETEGIRIENHQRKLEKTRPLQCVKFREEEVSGHLAWGKDARGQRGQRLKNSPDCHETCIEMPNACASACWKKYSKNIPNFFLDAGFSTINQVGSARRGLELD
jgi:hypothetical protein